MIRALAVVSIITVVCAGCKKGEEFMYPSYTPPPPASTVVTHG